MISIKKYFKENKIDEKEGFLLLQEEGLIISNIISSELGKSKGIITKRLYGHDYLSTDNIDLLNQLFIKDNKSGYNNNKKENLIVESKQEKTSNIAQKKPIKPGINKGETITNSFRTKFPANYRTSDWHFVRSKAEQIIDDYLYNNWIIHAYEKKLPVEEPLYTDFYIPLWNKVYIEYWGYENDSKYLHRKEKRSKYIKNIIWIL